MKTILKGKYFVLFHSVDPDHDKYLLPKAIGVVLEREKGYYFIERVCVEKPWREMIHRDDLLERARFYDTEDDAGNAAVRKHGEYNERLRTGEAGWESAKNDG